MTCAVGAGLRGQGHAHVMGVQWAGLRGQAGFHQLGGAGNPPTSPPPQKKVLTINTISNNKNSGFMGFSCIGD